MTKLQAKGSVSPSSKMPETRRRSSRGQHGQSLAEFALSLPILILLFFGMIDLGRAFFTLVSLNSVISEGANWAAAYPHCIASANNATNAAQVPAACRGTNSIIGRMLNENTLLDPTHIIAASVAPVTAAPGDVVTISISYRLDMVTPVIQAITSNIVLNAQVQEVVRSAGSPAATGVPMPYNYSVKPTNPVSDAAQTWTSPATGPTITCYNGLATLAWSAVSASGYHVFLNKVSEPYPAPTATLGAGTTTWTYNLGLGNHKDFTVTSYNDDGFGHIVDSDPTYVTAATCPDIVPTFFGQPDGWWCPTTTQAGFAWNMTAPIDTWVDGYAVYQVGGGLVGTATGNGAYSTTISISQPDTLQYYVQPTHGGLPIAGKQSTPEQINCVAGTGLLGHYYISNDTNPCPILCGDKFVAPSSLYGTRLDPIIDFNWAPLAPPLPGMPDTYFSVRWTGYLQPPCDGDYTFYALVDDGVRLTVNGTQLMGTDVTPAVSAWADHPWTTIPPQAQSIAFTLQQGKQYQIIVDYYQALGPGNSVIQLYWSSNNATCPGVPVTASPATSATIAIIPQSALIQ